MQLLENEDGAFVREIAKENSYLDDLDDLIARLELQKKNLMNKKK